MARMGWRTLHIVFCFVAGTVKSSHALFAERATLEVSAAVTAECDRQVTLHCNVSASPGSLTIKRLSWIRNGELLCGFDGKNLSQHAGAAASGFDCSYTWGRLSITFHKIQPLDSGASNAYICQLRSNQSPQWRNTTVELKDCCAHVDATLTDLGPSCNFTGVHPDGEVHWFHGAARLTGDALRTKTSMHVEAGGWLTIISSLESTDYGTPYNCSLWNPRSKAYVTSQLVEINLQQSQSHSGVGEHEPLLKLWVCWFVIVLLMK